MPVIDLQIVICAPVERVFDLSRSVELHADSTRHTGERAVAGVTKGLLRLDDEVTWEASHFGVRQRLTTRIVALEPNERFRDSMVAGAFRRFDHDHHFSRMASGTEISERFDFDSPFGTLGRIANVLFLTRYMRTFLETRLTYIKTVAESDAWTKYLSAG